MALEPTEGNENHALFKMGDFNTSCIVFELDLVSYATNIVISQRCVQV